MAIETAGDLTIRPGRLSAFDAFLCNSRIFGTPQGALRFVIEFIWFGVKEARSCLFAGLFFLSIFLVPKAGISGLPRYDVLLVVALSIQFFMLWSRLETWDEAKAIGLFHIVGFALELFKTSGSIGSWSYPDIAYTKVMGVPLFSGFMYAAVGSYIIQAWRLLDLRITHHPSYWMATAIALCIYLNFFTHHYIGDYRWYICACVIGLYAVPRSRSDPMTEHAGCRCFWRFCSSASSSGSPRIFRHSSGYGATQTRSACGRPFISANGVHGHCLSS